jgi:hypothetical protein
MLDGWIKVFRCRARPARKRRPARPPAPAGRVLCLPASRRNVAVHRLENLTQAISSRKQTSGALDWVATDRSMLDREHIRECDLQPNRFKRAGKAADSRTTHVDAAIGIGNLNTGGSRSSRCACSYSSPRSHGPRGHGACRHRSRRRAPRDTSIAHGRQRPADDRVRLGDEGALVDG